MKEETRIESECVAYAESLGWMSRKLDVGSGGKGWVDQIFLGPNGQYFFAEFKVSGEKPRGKQEKTIRRLRQLSHNVAVFTSVSQFKDFIHAITPW